MLKLTLFLAVLACLAMVIGIIAIPKIHAAKIIAGVLGAAVVVALVLFGFLYRAAHTLPEGAQAIERDADGNIKPTIDD